MIDVECIACVSKSQPQHTTYMVMRCCGSCMSDINANMIEIGITLPCISLNV